MAAERKIKSVRTLAEALAGATCWQILRTMIAGFVDTATLGK